MPFKEIIDATPSHLTYASDLSKRLYKELGIMICGTCFPSANAATIEAAALTSVGLHPCRKRLWFSQNLRWAPLDTLKITLGSANRREWQRCARGSDASTFKCQATSPNPATRSFRLPPPRELQAKSSNVSLKLGGDMDNTTVSNSHRALAAVSPSAVSDRHL